MALSVVFNSDLYDFSGMANIAARLVLLLQRMVEAADTSLKELSMMSSEESCSVLVEWNETIQPYPEMQTCPALLQAQALAAPDAVALLFEGKELSYSTMMVCTARLAGMLRQKAAGADRVVGLCVEKSMEEVLGMVGIMRAGAAYVPLDPKLPVDRLKYLVQQCECVSVASQRQYSEVAEAVAAGAAGVVVAEDVLYSGAAKKMSHHVSGSSLAYVLFTSGSTGKPKGVMIEHTMLTVYVHHTAMHPRLCLAESDVVLHAVEMTFDPSVELVWCALCAGSTLKIAPPNSLIEPEKLRQTFMDVTFTFLATSVCALYESSVEVAFPGTLKNIYIGGEAFPISFLQLLLSKYPTTNIWNQYGPTEVTITSHMLHLGPADASKARIPLGPVEPNTTGYILDSHLQPVPVGVPGELYLGGPKVARGYIGRPDITDKAFAPLATLPDAGKLYKTGDRVKWLPNGSVDFIGRVDFQVKLNGQRLEDAP